jgi:hypothetical protein
MNVPLREQARAIIADEIEGCSFTSGQKQDAVQRAEHILVALEAAGITLATAPPSGGFQTQTNSQPRPR